jgi:hypothetical protein
VLPFLCALIKQLASAGFLFHWAMLAVCTANKITAIGALFRRASFVSVTAATPDFARLRRFHTLSISLLEIGLKVGLEIINHLVVFVCHAKIPLTKERKASLTCTTTR